MFLLQVAARGENSCEWELNYVAWCWQPRFSQTKTIAFPIVDCTAVRATHVTLLNHIMYDGHSDYVLLRILEGSSKLAVSCCETSREALSCEVWTYVP